MSEENLWVAIFALVAYSGLFVWICVLMYLGWLDDRRIDAHNNDPKRTLPRLARR